MCKPGQDKNFGWLMNAGALATRKTSPTRVLGDKASCHVSMFLLEMLQLFGIFSGFSIVRWNSKHCPTAGELSATAYIGGFLSVCCSSLAY